MQSTRSGSRRWFLALVSLHLAYQRTLSDARVTAAAVNSLLGLTWKQAM